MNQNNKKSPELNPAEKYQQQLVDGLGIQRPSINPASEVLDQEQNPTNQADFEYDEQEKLNAKTKITGKDKAKRGGPAAALFLALSISMFGISGTFIVSSPLTMFTEVIKEKFDYNKPIIAQRMKNNLALKIRNMIDGYYGKIDGSTPEGMKEKKDRLENASPEQIERLKENGFEVDVSDSSGDLAGRQKINSIGGNGLDSPVDNFVDLQKNLDVNLVADGALSVANKNDFGVANDTVAVNLKTTLNIDVGNVKAMVATDGQATDPDGQATDPDGQTTSSEVQASDAEINSSMDKQLNDNVSGRTPVKIIDANIVDKENQLDPEIESDIKTINDQVDASRQAGVSAQDIGPDAVGGLINKGLGSTDFASTACGLYNAYITAINFSKIEGAMQLIRYGMTFIKMAEMIKAGDATEEEIAYTGSKLMAMVAVNNSQIKRNGLDSYGFKYASQNKVTDITNDKSAEYFQNATTSEISEVYRVLKSIPALPTVCGIFTSPLVSNGLIAASLVSMFTPAFWTGLTASIVIGEIVESTMQAGVGWLGQQLIASMTGLKVSSQTVGENTGNAVVSGMANYYNLNTGASGGGLLKKKDATRYAWAQRQLVDREAKIAQATKSPFDISTRHTFLGSIVFGLLPHYNTINTLGGQVQSLASLATSSLAAIMPNSQALALADDLNAYEQCSDLDYTEGEFEDVAFTPFCTPVRGFPIEVLYTTDEAIKYGFTSENKFVGQDFQVDDVFEFFANNYDEYFDDSGKPQGKLKSYSDNCVNRHTSKGPVPFGASITESATDPSVTPKSIYETFFGKLFSDGRECILSGNVDQADEKKKIMYGLYFTDERVQCMLDDGQNCETF